MIRSLLIANRGEIACRIIRTARAMGIATVAIYSDADAQALHVRMADKAVHIGPSPAAESYLRGDRIIQAALDTGAEAIHPGYGFLSENADFARAVIAAGLVWVGPDPASIEAMGLKDAAKQLMRAAGVPVTPGYDGADQSDERLAAEADAIGYPVLIKAVAGGGGKGMRKVDAPADFADALTSCRREAQASFGNAQVLLEKWITSPRHIEVQVFGDRHGNVVHLFERDCSLQRRHQKVIEEAPAPGMDEATRAAICGAAVRAAQAVDYVGAGTIEFIADASEGLRADRVFFMEMNTRLQVEHPVTEEITGVDLVEWQLRVASGEPLPLRQDELSINGWAMEARLYAEDPAKGFLPATGTPGPQFQPPRHVRWDSGVEAGDTITAHYDPMIAKVIAHGPDRAQCIAELRHALEQLVTWPLVNNGAFLHRLLGQAEFAAGEVDTGFIAQHLDELATPAQPSQQVIDACATAIALASGGEDTARALLGTALEQPASPWRYLVGMRTNGEPSRSVRVRSGSQAFVGTLSPGHGNMRYWSTPAGLLAQEAGETWLFTADEARSGGAAGLSDGAIVAPMPGKVIALLAAEGQQVAEGERLMVLEAMKMEHALTAPFAGTVTGLAVTEGAQVQVDQVLAKVVPEGG